MAATSSTMIPLGTEAPDFLLRDPATGEMRGLEDVKGENGLLVMFICNHCPYVKHVADELSRLGSEFMPKGIGVVAVNSNDAERYPDDAPERMVEEAERRGYPFPYLIDEDQEAARRYSAVCTPDFFLFDDALHLVYRGQLDDSRPGNGIPVTGRDLRRAMDSLLLGQPIEANQKASIGCSIKWKSGG